MLRIFSRQKDFFEMLQEQAHTTRAGIEALKEFILDSTQARADRVKQLEFEADEVRRKLVEELHGTFVTPIDREDIFALSRAIDDMLDYAKSTVNEMFAFEVKTNEHITHMVDALVEASQHLANAVDNLKHRPKRCLDSLVRLKKTENYVEKLYLDALVDLFKSKDVILILKTREIYRHLSNAADRGDEAANIVGDICIKNS